MTKFLSKILNTIIIGVYMMIFAAKDLKDELKNKK